MGNNMGRGNFRHGENWKRENKISRRLEMENINRKEMRAREKIGKPRIIQSQNSHIPLLCGSWTTPFQMIEKYWQCLRRKLAGNSCNS